MARAFQYRYGGRGHPARVKLRRCPLAGGDPGARTLDPGRGRHPDVPDHRDPDGEGDASDRGGLCGRRADAGLEHRFEVLPSLARRARHSGRAPRPWPLRTKATTAPTAALRRTRRLPLQKRRQLLEKKVLPKLTEPVRHAVALDAQLPVRIESVKAHGLEGLVAKRLDSRYESDMRSGAWQKMRVHRGGQEFVIGGYPRGTKTFDALVFGYYEGKGLIYVAHTRNQF